MAKQRKKLKRTEGGTKLNKQHNSKQIPYPLDNKEFKM